MNSSKPEDPGIYFTAIDQAPYPTFIVSIRDEIIFRNEAANRIFHLKNIHKLSQLPTGPTANKLLNSDGRKIIAFEGQSFLLEAKPLDDKHLLITCQKTEPDTQIFRAQRKSKVACWTFDGPTDKYHLSDEIFELFEQPKVTVPEVRLIDFFRFVHQEDISRLTNDFQKVLEGERSEIVFRIIINRRIKWLKAISNPILDEDKDFLRSFGTLEDVTFLFTDDENYDHSARNKTIQRKIQEMAKVGSWMWNTELNLVKWSDVTFNIFDLSPTKDNTIPADSYYNYIHPDDLDKSRPESVITKVDGTRGYEYRIVTPKGNTKHIFITEGQPLYNSKTLFGTLQDITHLKEKEPHPQQEPLRRVAKTENTLAQISLIFNSIKTMEEKISHALETLGINTSSMQVWVYEDSTDGESATKTYEWSAKDVFSSPARTSTILYKDVPSLTAEILKNGHLYVNDVASEAKDLAEIMQLHNTRTILIIPLTSGKKRIGFIGFNNYKKKDWKELIILQTVANIMADGLYNKSMEQALIRREAELREVQKIARIANFELNLLHDEAYISANLADMCGLKPGWQPGTNFSGLIHDEDKAHITAKFNECVANKKEYVDTYRIQHKSTAEEKYVASRGFIQFDKKGVPVRYVGTKQDVTQSMLQKLKIEETNSQLENIINNVPGAVYRRKTLECNDAKFLNKQVREIFGYEPQDFIPEGSIYFFDLVQESDREMLKKELSDSLKNQTPYEITYRAKDKFNNEKWIWDRGGFIRLGKEKYIQGIMVDITARVRAEDRVLSATLQAEDAERRRISKEINDGVQQTLISSMLSLQSLESFIQKANDPKLADRYKQGMEMLKSGIGETRDIAYNIMPKSIQDFGLINTLESMVQLLNQSSPINFIFYSNFKEERLSEKTEVSLYRICREAVNNILNYSQASEVSIQLTKQDRHITLNIEDNGKGFDNNDVKLLYNGFGISSMKSRANAVGGTFELESRINFGTNILVEIPDYKG